MSGQVHAITVVDKKSSAMPAASLPAKSAVHGAMTHAFAFFASDICSTSHSRCGSNVSTTTLLALRVSKVSGETNSVAFLVIATHTSAPCFLRDDTSSHTL